MAAHARRSRASRFTSPAAAAHGMRSRADAKLAASCEKAESPPRGDAGGSSPRRSRARAQGQGCSSAGRRDSAAHRRGRKAPDLRGLLAEPAGRRQEGQQAPTGVHDEAMRARAAALPAEAHDLRGPLPAAARRSTALAQAAAGKRSRGAGAALRERVVAAADVHRGRLDGGKKGPQYTSASGEQVPSQPGRGVHQGRGRAARPRHARSGARVLQAPPAGRVQAPARGGQAARRARSITRRTWSSRSSSTAATSGTTLPFDEKDKWR